MNVLRTEKMHIAAWLQENGLTAPLTGEAVDFVADSRLATPGAVFAALPGSQTDGARFAADAAARGAVLVLAERAIDAAVPVVVVPDLRARLPRLAATFFGRPSAALKVVGVTGTNGKTTTTYLIREALRQGGIEAGLIGTVAYAYGATTLPAPNTTPDVISLQRLYRTMSQSGCTAVVMEVSSHGLEERRADETAFDVAVFTNLTQDHLDYHGDMEAYYRAKSRLFAELLPAAGKSVRAVVNVDDPYGARLADETTAPTWRVSREAGDFVFAAPALHPAGFEVEVDSPFGRRRLACRLPGLHNVYNAVEAYAACIALGLAPERAAAAIAAVPGVPGRLEHFSAGGVHVYVDYAHTEDALANVLAALRPMAAGRLITVFGCGGDRDAGKRPRMGAVAGEKSDVVVVTSDNPRTEDPAAIVAAILPGVQGAQPAYDGARGYRVELDRRAAIAWAVASARAGDLVLVAGKGHEDYQILGREKFPFDDRAEVRAALARREVSA